MNCEFAYAPHQFVIVSAYGLRYEGMVLRCIKSISPVNLYLVEYAVDGEIKTAELYETQLEAAPCK